MTSKNKNGGDSGGTLYREPMGRLVLHYKKSKNLSGEAYIQSQTSQLGSRPGRENASSYFHAAVKPCRAHAQTIF